MNWNQILEDAIVGRVIATLLDAGFRIEISDQDGGGLFVYAAEGSGAEPEDGYRFWVQMTPGNTGPDLITDYTLNLETVLKPALKFAAQFGATV